MPRDEDLDPINYDLENFPFQIRTDSVVGSNKVLSVHFFTAKINVAGGVSLSLNSPPQYRLNGCSSYTDFLTSIPTETDNIWTITLTRTSGIRIIIHFNNKEVLNVVLSDTTCDSWSDWISYWSKKVEKIGFYHDGTAYYRPGK